MSLSTGKMCWFSWVWLIFILRLVWNTKLWALKIQKMCWFSSLDDFHFDTCLKYQSNCFCWWLKICLTHCSSKLTDETPQNAESIFIYLALQLVYIFFWDKQIKQSDVAPFFEIFLLIKLYIVSFRSISRDKLWSMSYGFHLHNIEKFQTLLY